MKNSEIARALREADWSDTPIGNKALIVAAADALDPRTCDCFGDSGMHASTHQNANDKTCCDLCGWPVRS